MTPKEINDKKFSKSLLGGYRKNDVIRYLNTVAKEYQALLDENYELKEKVSSLSNEVNNFKNEENSIRSALINAQKLGDKVLSESKEKAELIIKEAEVKAENIVEITKKQLENERQRYQRLRDEIGSFKNKVYALYKDHLSTLNTLPDEGVPYDKIVEEKPAVQLDETTLVEKNDGSIAFESDAVKSSDEDNN